LVAGDKIIVPATTANDGVWFWDGLYWRSAQNYHVFDTSTWTVTTISSTTNGSPTGKIIRPDLAIYATRISTVYQCNPTLNAGNRWDIVVFRSIAASGAVSLVTPGAGNLTASGLIPSNNFLPPNNADRTDNIIFQYQKVGSPSNLVARSILEYQLIRP
jgi:hypothetical protein